MLILVILLWLMSAIVLLTNLNDEKMRWVSYIGICGGFGGLGAVLGTGINRPEWILVLDGISTSFGHYWTAYCIAFFGLLYSESIKTRKQKRVWKAALAIPPIAMYLPIFPFHVYPEFHTIHAILAIWIVPYVLMCFGLMVYSAIKETRISIKRQKIITCITVIPMIAFPLITNIILEGFGVVGAWIYNPLIIIVQFGFFIYFGTRYGILGVQIKFEKQKRDSTMKAVTSGTALLNHTIKNEVAKIDLLTTQLKNKVDGPESENIELILKSTSHVLELSNRIQNKLDIMNLKETDFWLSNLIDTSIDLLQPLISEVKIKKNYEMDVKVYGDFVHLQETTLNILKNAIEAMGSNPSITIKIYLTRGKVFIDFNDNGKGIEKDKISSILDPFYSTKKRVGNFGLGLTYCYNVMTKHQGDITVKSQINQGTTITLILPKKRVIEIQEPKLELTGAGEMIYG
ncbi:HAMP domain-containing histidine kinase [Robertmurraya korlensis]|uniref:ATP-binding protein n=1 Tax=Robertmurraya korlensis TaxID=519977 RepID=UPI00203E2982|nr:HAMP domain-containing sensor histidine kinase [Robertmurraya korlensis]MCM3603136.1 HAMP domain-containing histidine kinase [Robertmurraya korlensis]